jgi:hypothetical protein
MVNYQVIINVTHSPFESITYDMSYTNVTHLGSYNYKPWQLVIFVCFMVPVIVLSIVGNVFVIIAVWKKPYLQIAGNIFLASLAVADCLLGVFVMPMNAIQVVSGRWHLKAFTCRYILKFFSRDTYAPYAIFKGFCRLHRFWFSLDVMFSTASILHLFCVSVDRFLSTSNIWAFRYKAEDPTTSWRIRIMLSLVWLTSALLSFIPIFTDLFTTNEHAQVINKLDYENGQCQFIVNTPYMIVSSLLTFWLPGVGMVVFYCLVMHKAYKCAKSSAILPKKPSKINLDGGNNPHDNHLKTSSLSQYSFSFQESESGNTIYDEKNFLKSGAVNLVTAKERSVKWNREYKALKTLGTVIIIFLLCWFFFFLNYVLCHDDGFLNCTKVFGKQPYIDDILFWIGYSNSMINPFLYNFTNHDFRRAFRSLLSLDKYKNRVARADSKPRKGFVDRFIELASFLKPKAST